MLNQRLKELRKQKGITQEQLAAIIDVERSSVGKYESLEKPVTPSSDVLIKMSEYFGVSIDYLLGIPSPTPQKVKSPVYDDEALELMEEMHKRPELKVLFSTSMRAKREDIEAVDRLLRHMTGCDEDD